MRQFLALGPALVQLVVQRWADERGVGDLASLPDALRAAAQGDASLTPTEADLDQYLEGGAMMIEEEAREHRLGARVQHRGAHGA